MVFFIKKKEEIPEPPVEYIPVDLVQRFASQGMSEPEIISRLQTQGFKPSQIEQALRLALKAQVAGPVPVEEAPRPELPETPTMEMPAPRPEFQAAIPVPPITRRPLPETARRVMGVPPERIIPPSEPRAVILSAPETGEAFTFEEKPEETKFEIPESGEITLEEIIEGILADKWEDFENRLAIFEKRDLQLQGQIEDLRRRIEETEKSIKEREQTLIGRFEEFGESMTTIEGRIGSIEKVFREFLPELTQNIKTMSDIAEKMQAK